MKKKLIAIVCLLLASALVFTGCTGYSSVKVDKPQTDFDYIVYSNGGSAVQYGNYVYFINGTRGYDDEDGKQNRWGEVVKGGIYRAELSGSKSGKDWNVETDRNKITSNISGKLYDFKFDASGDIKNYDDEPIDWVLNTKVAPVTAGTSGYAKGGIFIYDEYIYFATPNNQRNREGTVQTTYTDFMCMRLDGSGVRKIFTTQGEAASKPYGFYKMGDSVFLVCAYENEDDSSKMDVVSVRTKGSKIYNPVYLTQEATQVYFPSRQTYDKNDKKVSLEDFVFYTRDLTKNDEIRTGNAIEVCRPDGSEAFSYAMNGKTTQIEDVRDGLLFFTADNGLGDTIVKYTNLHDSLMNLPDPDPKDKKAVTPPPESQTYRAYEASATAKRSLETGDVFILRNLADFTTKYYFGGQNSNGAYMLGMKSDGVFLYSAVDFQYSSGVRVYSADVSMLFINDGWLYYSEGDSIYRTHIFTALADKAEASELLTDRAFVSAGIVADVVADHLMFFANYDEWTEGGGYSYFKKLRPGSESFFVGTLAEADIPDEDELEEYQNRSETANTAE